MLRFIFVCMGIVALSMLSVGMQFMTDGISDAQSRIAERNTAAETLVAAVAQTQDTYQDFSPEQLNLIETAAGDTTDTGFGSGFTNTAPKALADAPAIEVVPTETMAVSEDTAN